MRQSYIERLTLSCRRCVRQPEAAEDAKLVQLFHELTLTLSNHMEPDDADILARSELRGQTLSEIAAQIGCSQTEATLRLNHARRCFCHLLVQTLTRLKSG